MAVDAKRFAAKAEALKGEQLTDFVVAWLGMDRIIDDAAIQVAASVCSTLKTFA